MFQKRMWSQGFIITCCKGACLFLCAIGFVSVLFGENNTAYWGQNINTQNGHKTETTENRTTDNSVLQFDYTISPLKIIGLDNAKKRIIGKSLVHPYGKYGEPIIPILPLKIIIPDGYEIDSIYVQKTERTVVKGTHFIEFAKKVSPINGKNTEKLESLPDPNVYESNKVFPVNSFSLVSVQKKRGVQLALINLHPIEYLPKTGKVFYYKHCCLEIFTKPKKSNGSNTLSVRISPLELKQLGVANIESFNAYGKRNEKKGAAMRDVGLCDAFDSFQYVVITNRMMRDAKTDVTIQDLVAHKNAKGISATLVAIEDIYECDYYLGSDNAESVRNFIKDAYENWETDYVLLGGDISIIPTRKLYCHTKYTSDNIPSDLYFQCLDGDFNDNQNNLWGEPTDGENGGEVDLFAEVFIGRAPVENADEMSHFVYKTLAYENEDLPADYLHNALMVGEYLGNGGASEYATESLEEIRLGSNQHGYTTEGFASCKNFMIATLYDSEEYTWNKSSLISKINSSSIGIINHIGYENNKLLMRMSQTDATSLKNKNGIFIYSQESYAGDFENQCIGKTITTANRHGMFAGIFNSKNAWAKQNSTDGPSQRFNRRFWDAYFGEYVFNIGAMNTFSHEDNFWDIDNDVIRWCYYQTNLFGDPQTELKGIVVGPYLHCASHSFSDHHSGNDSIINPGETVEMNITLGNIGNAPGSTVSASLSSEDPHITMINSQTDYGDFECCGDEKNSNVPFSFKVDESVSTPYTAIFKIQIFDTNGFHRESSIPLTIYTWRKVSGFIKTYTGHFPLEASMVTFQGLISGTVKADKTGYYSFQCPEGMYTVWAQSDGYLQSKQKEITVSSSIQDLHFFMHRPILSIYPKQIQESLYYGKHKKIIMKMNNAGDADLHFSISALPLSETKISSNEINNSDLIDYRWIDSDQNGGPQFEWHDISETGTKLTLELDSYVAVPLPFSFRFYHKTYDELFINSSGYISMSPGPVHYFNEPIPKETEPNGIIAAFWGDLDPQAPGAGVYFQQFQDYVIIQYDKIQPVGDNASVYTFQIVLHKNGTIICYYNIIEGKTNNATIGIENLSGKRGLQVAHNESYIHSQLAIQYRQSPNWLSINPMDGVLSPKTTQKIEIAFSSIGLMPGVYKCHLYVWHNDPASSQPDTIPIDLSIKKTPRLMVEPGFLDFGTTKLHTVTKQELIFSNKGNYQTTIKRIRSFHPAFKVISNTPLIIPPFGEEKVTVEFKPYRYGAERGRIRFYHDGFDPLIHVGIRGECRKDTNPPPEVNAGNDTVMNIGELIRLNGTASDNGEILTYEWKFWDKDWIATTTGDTVIQLPTIVRPFYTCSLRVTDNGFKTAIDEMRIYIQDIKKGPYLLYSNNTAQMKVLWQQQYSGVTKISWGLDSNCTVGSISANYEANQTNVCVISDLTPNTKYYYRVYYTLNTFISAPDHDATKLKFMAYGDTRSNPGTHDMLANHMLSLQIQDSTYQTLAIATGDLINNGRDEQDWSDQFFNKNYQNIQNLLASKPFFSCVGNHEFSGNGTILFEKYFPYPYTDLNAGYFFSFDYGPAHFTFLDQYTPNLDPEGADKKQFEWMEKDLRTSDKKWKFVVLHMPGWSAGGHDNDEIVQRLQPYFKKHGVDIVFAGHNHYYARAFTDEIHHLTVGGGGAPLYEPDSYKENIVYAEKTYHYCTVAIIDNTLTLKTINLDGKAIDQFQISKTSLAYGAHKYDTQSISVKEDLHAK